MKQATKFLKKLKPNSYELNLGFIKFLWGNGASGNRGGIKAGGDIKAGKDISATGNIEAKGNVRSGKDIIAGKS